MWYVFWGRVSVIHWLVTQNPRKFQGSFILNGNYFDHFFENFFIKGMLCHLIRIILFVLYCWELIFDDLAKLINILLSINDHFHEIWRVMTVVEIEKHFSEIWVGESGFITGRELWVGMAWFCQMFSHLIFSPCVILKVFGVFRVNSVELPFRGWVEHQGTDEELSESIQGRDKGITGNFEMKVSLLLGSVSIGGAWVFGNKLSKNGRTFM